MTDKEFKRLVPGKSIVRGKVEGDETERTFLLKFLMCFTGDDYDGYWMCLTEDMTNPEPTKVLDTDIFGFANLIEVVKL